MDVGALIDFSKAVGPKLFRTLRKNSLLKIGTLLIVQRKVPVIEAQAEQEAEAHGEETQQKSKPGESKVDKVGKVEEEKPTGVREGEDGVGAVGEEAETAPAPASEASKAMEVDEGEGAAAKVGSAGDDCPLPAVLTGAWIEERGWTAEMRTRRGGSTQGMTDKYWTPPAKTEVPAGFQGQRTGFRSLPEVRRFLAAVDDYEEEGGDDGSDEGEEDGDGDEEGERDEEMAAEVAADGGAGADAAFEDGTDATDDAHARTALDHGRARGGRGRDRRRAPPGGHRLRHRPCDTDGWGCDFVTPGVHASMAPQNTIHQRTATAVRVSGYTTTS
jgi:hypothetical protein